MKVYTKQSKMWGTIRTDRPPKGIMRACDLILIIMCVVTVFLRSVLVDNDFPAWCAFIPLAIIGPFCLISRISVYRDWKHFCEQMHEEHANDEADEEEPEELPSWSAEESFYNKCVENQISNLDAVGVARMKLLAKQLNMECGEEALVEKFKKGQANAANRKQILERNQKRLKLKTLREQEALQERVSKKYIDSVGSAKRVNECMDEAMQCRSKVLQLKKEAEEYTKKMSAIGTAFTQKETDWAVHGGIASGIAGTAAGVAVAADIQRKNAEIRAANEQFHETVANAAGSYLAQNRTQIRALEEQAAHWDEEAEKAKLKLIEEQPQDQLLEMLNPRVLKTEVSETGAIILMVSTNAASLEIYETVKATIDGSFKINIIDGENVAGEAYITLPFKGSENSATLTGICTNLPQKKQFIFEFAPHNLFAIEL